MCAMRRAGVESRHMLEWVKGEAALPRGAARAAAQHRGVGIGIIDCRAGGGGRALTAQRPLVTASGQRTRTGLVDTAASVQCRATHAVDACCTRRGPAGGEGKEARIDAYANRHNFLESGGRPPSQKLRRRAEPTPRTDPRVQWAAPGRRRRVVRAPPDDEVCEKRIKIPFMVRAAPRAVGRHHMG